MKPKKLTHVKLLKSLAPDELPVGTTGAVTAQTLGMLMVRWENGMEIAMFRNEVEAI